MTTCKNSDCDLEAIENNERCPLHLPKIQLNLNAETANIFENFHYEFCKYIYNELTFEIESSSTSRIPPSQFLRFLMEQKGDTEEKIKHFLSGLEITISDIEFPDRKKTSSFDYFKTLELFKGIWFRQCGFSVNTIEFSTTKVYFERCTFHSEFYIKNNLLLNNDKDVMFNLCRFKNKSSTYYSAGETINPRLFSNCQFDGKLCLDSTTFTSEVFCDEESSRKILKELSIEDCKFSNRFILNGYDIRSVNISNSKFSSKFEFKYNTVDKVHIDNTNFLDLVDTYNSKFSFFYVKKSIFEKIATFEESEFGKEKPASTDELVTAKFNHVTFLDFTNFRDTKFHYGLDIRNTNLKEPPNFIGAKIEPKHTNRETLQIVKHSFDRLGNQIEANKFFVLEMKKYKEEIQRGKNWQDRFILWANEITSDFGQDYILPILWMITISLLYYDVGMAMKLGLISNTFPFGSSVYTYLNELAKSALPFAKFLIPGREFSSLFLYITYAALIWQTVSAIKRHTKK
ncbi:hypothetical protein [Microbulbifer aggregans]|uniref:hypothetical protein n=1 Tax=Microbulbifer aggregans TaxID=1769779 RepID=UPI001CFE9122|nr:hypothetical protein [Microbulbifer aggregans]